MTNCTSHGWIGIGVCPKCSAMAVLNDTPTPAGSPELARAFTALGNVGNLSVVPVTQSKDPLAPHYRPERLEDENLKEYHERANKIRRLLQPATSMYTVQTVEHLLTQLTQEQRDTYVCALRDVVGSPRVGGSGQYLGSLTPLVFATREQKLEAVLLMERWNWDQEFK